MERRHSSSVIGMGATAVPFGLSPHAKGPARGPVCSWSGQRDSNPRMSAWEADALPLGDARVPEHSITAAGSVGFGDGRDHRLPTFQPASDDMGGEKNLRSWSFHDRENRPQPTKVLTNRQNQLDEHCLSFKPKGQRKRAVTLPEATSNHGRLALVTKQRARKGKA